MLNNVYHCSIIELSRIHNRAGNLTAVESQTNAPFNIKRVYYLYDVPGGANRGGHAHRVLNQFIVAVSGAFDVVLDDGINKKVIHLDRPYFGLYILPGIWREIFNFSSGAVCLVLASEEFNQDDYIRDYNEFLKYRKP